MEDFTPDVVMVMDEEGGEHMFEALDRIETDDGHFIALAPLYDNEEDIPEEDEFIVLEVHEEEEESYLAPIENEKLLDEIGNLFEERLAIMFSEDEDDNNQDD